MYETERKGDAGWWETTYDPNGNLIKQIAKDTSKQIFDLTYTCNPKNQLISFHETGPDGTKHQENRYDFTGMRIVQLEQTSGLSCLRPTFPKQHI